MRELLSGDGAQVNAVVSIIRETRPDIVVLADVDWDLGGEAVGALAEAIGGYPHRFAARPNRGADSGGDLDGDGKRGGAGDAHGYAEFAGQGGMAVLSRFPFGPGFRDFTSMAWGSLPGHLAGADEGSHRLSTTVHWDLPVTLPDGTSLSLLVWHATPPVFDRQGDRNKRRNHDEAAFWRAYLDGAFGPPAERFVLLGAANLDPKDGDGRQDALSALLGNPRVQDVRPASEGGLEAAMRDGGVNIRQTGDPRLDTADWPDGPGRPGNLRVDYVLPAAGLDVLAAGVFWPLPGTSFGGDAERASRHRLVWVDIALGSE